MTEKVIEYQIDDDIVEKLKAMGIDAIKEITEALQKEADEYEPGVEFTIIRGQKRNVIDKKET